MIWLALLVVGSAGLIGSAFVLCFWEPDGHRRSDFLLVASLGQGLGLGVTSVVFFLSSLLSSHPLRLCATLEIFAAVGLGWRLCRRAPTAETQAAPSRRRRGLSDWLLGSLFAQAALASLAVAIQTYLGAPHGEWDGWAIWSLHARFLWLSGTTWPHVMTQPSLDWSHTDYPLLVSASVARGWMYVGSDPPVVPGLISVVFAACTVGVLVGLVARLRGWSQAWVGGLVLLGTPLFLKYAGRELADIPVGFFMLAATGLVIVSGKEARDNRMAFLAGIAAGFAAWSKNEGLMFCTLAAATYGGIRLIQGRVGPFRSFVAAALVALLPVLYFKFWIAPSNDIVGGQGWGTIDKLFLASRHRLILASFWHEAATFGEWRYCPLIAMGLCLIGPGSPRMACSEWFAPVIALLMAAGYYCVYLVTPNDLSWHLESSLNRLFLQIWPMVVFVWCLAAPPSRNTSDPSNGSPSGPGWRRTVGCIGANLLLAMGWLMLIYRKGT